MPSPFFIVGPTAVGKSSLAVKIAAKCGAEIIGADAFQIYVGFERLTAKPSPEERLLVPHHLIGRIALTETYNVARYLEDARRCLEAVFCRSKPVIVVGGTGLYVKALTHGLSPLPEASPTIRAELESFDPPALLVRLRALDPVAADTIDCQNKRRLVRAVEVCLLTGKPFSSHQNLWAQTPSTGNVNGVFLTRSKADLHARIERRVTAMFDQGVIEEIQAAQSIPLSATASRMIGWQDLQNHLAGQQSLSDCQEKIKLATRQYAKRQVTWFQREKNFESIDLSAMSGEEAQVAHLTERFQSFIQRHGTGFHSKQTLLDESTLRN